jgi:hypothetical protein
MKDLSDHRGERGNGQGTDEDFNYRLTQRGLAAIKREEGGFFTTEAQSHREDRKGGAFNAKTQRRKETRRMQ